MTERRVWRLGLLAFFVVASVIVTIGYAAASRSIVRATIARAAFFERSLERRHVRPSDALPRIAEGLRFPGIRVFARTDGYDPVRYDDAPLVAHEVVTVLLADPDVVVRIGSGSIVIAPNMGPLFFALAVLAMSGLALGIAVPALAARFVPLDDASNSAPRAHAIVADVSHELRTPLTVVMGYVDLLHTGRVRDTETQHVLYDRVLAECRRMRSLIECVLSLARIEGGSGRIRTPVDVAALVDDVVRHLDPPLAGRLSVAPCAGAVVLANGDDLREALGNLVQNALRYTAGAVTVSLRRQGGDVVTSVADDGPGMSADDVAHAFERFFRGSNRPSGEGSGLGLAIAKAAVERNGGTISLASSVGAGTTLTLRFTRCRMPARELQHVAAHA